MRGTHRLGILAALVALLVISVAVQFAARRGTSEVQDTASSDAPAESRDAEVLAALGASTVGDGPASSSIELTATPGEIRGVLLDPDGKPVPGVIELSGWSDSYFRVRQGSSIATDAVGRFRLTTGKLMPPFWVRPLATVLYWAAGIQATPGGEPVVIRLRARPSVRVTVLDPSGAPVDGAGVGIFLKEAPNGAYPYDPLRAWTDEDVAVSAARAPAGSFAKTDARGVAVVAHPGADRECTLSAAYQRMDRDDIRPFFNASWKPVDCTVRLPASYVVEGTVRDGAGTLVPDGTVAWRTGDDAPWQETKVAYDGTFRIAGLEGGSITIEPRLEDVVLPEGMGRSVVAAGALDVPLTLDLGSTLEVVFLGWPDDAVGARAYLTKEPAGPGARSSVVEVERDGTCRFRGVRPGASYTLFLPCRHAALMGGTEEAPIRRIAYRTHLTIADSPAKVEILEGKSVGGRIVLEALPADQHDSVASSADFWIADRGIVVTGSNDGTQFHVEGVPEGEWDVDAMFAWWATGPDGSWNTFISKGRCRCTTAGDPGTLRFEAGKPGTPPSRHDR